MSTDVPTPRSILPHARGPLLATLITLPVLLLSLGAPATAQPEPPFTWLWREGESADRHDFNNHGWYCCDGVQRDLLSPGTPGGRDGDWLSHYANGGPEASATYALSVPRGDRYRLWLRLSSFEARYRWSLGGAGEGELDTAIADRREVLNLRADRRPEIRYLSWFRAADVTLEAGRHELRITVLGHPARDGGQEVHGGIDALALVAADAPWGPTGALKPPSGDQPPPDPAAWFPFVPWDDPFSEDSVTDASHLLHRPAGQHGALRRDGAALRFTDGTPAVFWGVNAHPPATPELAERQARWLAKHGVNLVRLHPVQSVVGLLQRDPATGERRLDPALLDRLDRWFATLKNHGIYMAWSPVYPHIVTEDDGYPPELMAELSDANTWSMPPGVSGKSSSGVVNVMPRLQDAEWQWLRAVLNHQNPYTGVRYVNDPALAFVETHNEDSIFWHFPLNPLQDGEMPLHLRSLQRRWAAWLAERYDSDAALLAAWGPARAGSRPGDSLRNEQMPIYGAWEFGADGPPQHPQEQQRLGDWIRFLAETQRAYFDRRESRLRAAGYEAVTITTAWQSGGPAAHAANLWTDDAAEAIDRHSYFGGGEGLHSVRTGSVSADTHLRQPGTGILARGLEQLEDKPFLLSEWTQSPPNPWKAEIAPLFTYYGMGLHGWDASLHFSADQDGRYGGGWPNENSYVTETPHYAGQFAALARSVHEGHVRQGPLAAARRLRTDDLFRGVDPLNRSVPSGGWAGEAAGAPLTVPPEVVAIGRTTLRFAADPGRSERLDWSRYWDPAAQRVQSATEELEWDMARRVVQVRSDRSQGLIGWAGGAAWRLPAAEIEVQTPFVSLLFTALDQRPLQDSAHVLITALARDRQTGARYNADFSRLEALGGPPLLLEPVRARIAWQGAPLRSARALDLHGVPREGEIERDGNTIVLDGRWQAFRYELRTDGAQARATEATPVSPTPSASPSTPPSSAPPSSTPTVTSDPATPPLHRRLWLPQLQREG